MCKLYFIIILMYSVVFLFLIVHLHYKKKMLCATLKIETITLNYKTMKSVLSSDTLLVRLTNLLLKRVGKSGNSVRTSGAFLPIF